MYPSFQDPAFEMLATPTDPKFAEMFARAKRKDAARSALAQKHSLSVDPHAFLVAAVVAAKRAGFEQVQIVKLLVDQRFVLRDNIGGDVVGPSHATVQQAIKWAVETWHAAAPERREVIINLRTKHDGILDRAFFRSSFI